MGVNGQAAYDLIYDKWLSIDCLEDSRRNKYELRKPITFLFQIQVLIGETNN